MFLALRILLAVEVIVASGISPPDIPNITDFTSILSKEQEFRIDDYKTAFLGRIVVYQNPNDPNEFVRVYYRQIAIVSERAKEKNTADVGGRNTNLSNLKYHQKRETEALDRVQQAVDAFAYVRWWMVRDSRTKQDIQTGPMQIWLLDPSGAYAYYSQPEGVEESALKYSSFSEPFGSDFVTVGLKFTLGDTVHIVRVDRNDISAQVGEAKNEKK